jgi:hypothetical protein
MTLLVRLAYEINRNSQSDGNPRGGKLAVYLTGNYMAFEILLPPPTPSCPPLVPHYEVAAVY